MKLSDLSREELKRRIYGGSTYKELAEEFGCSHEWVRQWIKKLEIPTTRQRQSGMSVEEYDFYLVCKSKYRQKKSTVIKSGQEFSAQFTEIVWNKVCPILGIEIDYDAEGRKDNSPSFSLIDPDLGYIAGNVEIISWKAGRMKYNNVVEDLYLVWKYMSMQQNK